MNNRVQQQPSASPLAWAIVLLVAALVRTAVVVVPGSFGGDPDGYRLLARNLLDTGSYQFDGVPTAYRPPAYPTLLALLFSTGFDEHWLLVTLHSVLGTATAVLVYFWARRLGLARWSIAAAMLVVFDPVLLIQSRQVMTETLAAFLVAATLLATDKAMRGSFSACFITGVLAAMCALCRANLLPWAVLLCIVPTIAATSCLPQTKYNSFLTALSFAAAAVTGFVLVYSIWVTRNYLVFGKPVLATTHGGYTLLLANNDWYYDHLEKHGWRKIWDASQFNRWWREHALRRNAGDELSNQAQAYRLALQTMRKRSRMFLLSCLVRAAKLWSPLPYRRTEAEPAARTLARWAVAAFYILLYIAAATGLLHVVRWRHFGGLRRWLPALLLFVVLTAVHAVFWSDMRMRAPMVPALAVLAAIGLQQAARSFWQTRTLRCANTTAN